MSTANQLQPPESGTGDEASSSAIETEEERLRQAADRRLEETYQPTSHLEAGSLDFIPEVARLPFGTKMGAAKSYTLVPASAALQEIPADAPYWRIELHGVAPGVGPLGFDVVDDAIIGRNHSSQHIADIDLAPYRAIELGVSRRHAMLRPTPNKLFLLDLESTNGTQHNALTLGPGLTRALAHNDTVTFGKLSCTIHIIDSPLIRQQEGR
jgi:hypothetical protein